MDCPNWPPPLPSLPLYPPCVEHTVRPESPPPEVKVINSKTQEWWDAQLGPFLKCFSDPLRKKKELTFELTRKQRRALLSIRVPKREDEILRSVPFPARSYPSNGFPIWERLYLDQKLPMLKPPPNALVFARQLIGKKLWKDTEGQEFILYDPNSYEVTFSYENVHDPHLTNYYRGKEIRGFLLRLGDATEDGWGLCSLKKFNQYRRYLKRVHLSLVHTEMQRQEALKDEIHKIKEYRQTTKHFMEYMEQKVMVDEMRAAIVEGLRIDRENRIKRILDNIQEKEMRVRKLQKKRNREQDLRRQRGLKLLAEQELKNTIAKEIERRKKIQTLRRWHDLEEKIEKRLKKQAEETAKLKAEKVRIRWENKIKNSRKMYEKEDEYLKLQSEIRKRNIEIRNALSEKRKQKEIELFQEIQKTRIRNRAMVKKKREDKRMEKAITQAWLGIIDTQFDLATEIYRIKKSINSTLAELRMTQMAGPDRFTIILMSRNRIQMEQKIPLQVSFAIDAILETSIQQWVNKRLVFLLETVMTQAKENSHTIFESIKAQYKDLGIPKPEIFKTKTLGEIFQQDSIQRYSSCDFPQVPCDTMLNDSAKAMSQSPEKGSEKETDEVPQVNKQPIKWNEEERQGSAGVLVNYVHFGKDTIHEYSPDVESEGELKASADRPKTPMPSQEELAEAGFSEEKLNDILPVFNEEVATLKEKGEFSKVLKKVAIKLFDKSIEVAQVALEPKTRIRAINKLINLEDTETPTLISTLSELIINHDEKQIYEKEEFEWLAKVIAKEAIRDILNPPEFNKTENEMVSRMKIMFYKPKTPIKTKLAIK